MTNGYFRALLSLVISATCVGLTISLETVSRLQAQDRVARTRWMRNHDNLDRTSLPISEPRRVPIATLDARDAKAPPRFEVKAPAGAPNVLIVLIDDMGFGQSSAFGGAIHTPNAQR